MTPTVEMDLCGHATLASAHVLFQHLARPGTMVRFQSRSGEPTVEQAGDRFDYFAVFDQEQDVVALAPDFGIIAELDAHGVIVTAPGDDCDFVSRYFAPRVGVPEDPVTGSTHCALVPYWSKRLGRRILRARQLSKRGGELFC
jgi:predicted PhzF superfamily epimerase YddE/YHI9